MIISITFNNFVIGILNKKEKYYKNYDGELDLDKEDNYLILNI